MMFKKFVKKHSVALIAVLIALTTIEFIYVFFFDDSTTDLKETLPWLVVGTIISEVMFVLGVLLMAYSLEHSLGWNPIKWRAKLKDVIKEVPNSRIFWLGFWINAIGAMLTGVVWALAIIKGLPPSAWGALWLPVLDIVLTLGLRATVLELKREKIIG